MTVISALQGASGYKVPWIWPKFGSKLKNSKDKAFLNIMPNFGGIIANEQNMMDTCTKNKGMRHCAIIQESGNIP